MLVVDESGSRRYCRVATRADELACLVAACASGGGGGRVGALCAGGAAAAWVSTYTVAMVGGGVGADEGAYQLAVSVLGDATGGNGLRASRVRGLLARNPAAPALAGPVLVRVETAGGALVSPARAFASGAAFLGACERALASFECGTQWRFCPRTVKTPAPAPT